MDITSFIRSIRAEKAGDVLTVTAVTAAEQENYLNPEYIAQAVESAFGVSGTSGWHVIDRTRLLLADGETDFV